MKRKTLLCTLLLLPALNTAVALTVKTTENGYGWELASSSPVTIINLSEESADWMLPPRDMGRFTGNNLEFEKLDADLITFLGVSGNSENIDSNHVDSMQVYFTAAGDVFSHDGLPFDFLVPDPYFGVSWQGSVDGTGSMAWRIDIGTGTYQIIHWWNHGSGFNAQTLEIQHYADDGTLRASDGHEVSEPLAMYFTTEIIVAGGAAGDYLMIRQRGNNAGYRGTVSYLLDAGGPEVGEWVEDARLGNLQFMAAGMNWWWSPALGFIYTQSPERFYHPANGWFYHDNPCGSLTSPSGIYFYSYERARWVWTSSAVGGRLHVFKDGFWQP